MWADWNIYAARLAFFLLVIALACVALGAFLMWLIPLVWDWLKPIIHGATA